MYKFQGFQVGQVIRAHDFEPISGREECSVEGVIEEVSLDGSAQAPFAHYVIRATADTWRGVARLNEYSRIGRAVYVPMETMMDWDGRVALVESTDPRDAEPFRLAQRLRDCTVFLSGWSQHRLQPTFSQDPNAGLIWHDQARFDRWKAKHASAEWGEIVLEKFMVPPARDRGGERFRRLNRRAIRR